MRYTHILYSYGTQLIEKIFVTLNKFSIVQNDYNLQFIINITGRTGAVYLTILVTIERYLVVAFPVKSKAWLTPFKSKIYVLIVLFITFLLDLPWIFNSTVAKNTYIALSPNTSLVNFPYILNGTSFSRYVYPKIRMSQLFANYVAPFPLLLIFNGLLYLSVS